VLYDLRIAAATATRLPDGRYRVDARVDAARAAVQDGQETALAMNDALEVAVYAESPEAPQPLAKARHVIRGSTDLSIIVSQRPGYVAIDPELRVMDRNPRNNVRKVEEAEYFSRSVGEAAPSSRTPKD